MNESFCRNSVLQGTIHTMLEKFQNEIITSQCVFVFEENSDREITCGPSLVCVCSYHFTKQRHKIDIQQTYSRHTEDIQ